MSVTPLRALPTVLVAVTLAGGIARADGTDDQFLALLARDKIAGAPDQMIGFAHERCDDGNLPRSGGYNWRFGAQPGPYGFAIGNFYREMEAAGLDSGQVAQFTRDAIAVYCPEQKGR